MTAEEIISNWKKITFSLKKLYKNNDIVLVTKTELFQRLLKNLPMTVLVNKSFRSEKALIQGVIDLFTSKEFYLLSPKQRKTISFIFEEQIAYVYSSYYRDGNLIFSGEWTDALSFILEEIVKMPVRKDLTVGQKSAIEELTKQLKIKKGS